MEMTSTCFVKYLDELLSKGLCKMSDLDEKVENILRVKLKLNLFENYYTILPNNPSFLIPNTKKQLKIKLFSFQSCSKTKIKIYHPK